MVTSDTFGVTRRNVIDTGHDFRGPRDGDRRQAQEKCRSGHEGIHLSFAMWICPEGSRIRAREDSPVVDGM